jgi:hypothetical protein
MGSRGVHESSNQRWTTVAIAAILKERQATEGNTMPDAPTQIILPPALPPAHLLLLPEELPNVANLIIEDGKPVDNIFSERQMRLLVEPLYSSWVRPEWIRSLIALANVGMFSPLTSRHSSPMCCSV